MNTLIPYISQNPRTPGLILLAVSVLALGSAFFVQYVLGIEPCVLCIYQRIPYAAVGIFALFAIIAKPGGFTQQFALSLSILAFIIGASVAFYHVGVEEKWWVSACSSTLSTNLSFEDLKATLMATPLKSCDQKDWVIFDISITVYNTVFSIFMAGVTSCLLYIVRQLKAHTTH